MFRAIYKAAEGIERVCGMNDSTIYSENCRGVIQGDIISPVFFILTMEQLFRTHNNYSEYPARCLSPTSHRCHRRLRPICRISQRSGPQEFSDITIINFDLTAITSTPTTNPNKRSIKGVTRKVSERTKALFQQRRHMQGTEAQYKKVQSDIVKSSLEDYETWVGEWVGKIQAADGQGNTKEVYTAVKKLEARPEKPPINIAKDSDGRLLTGATDVARVWEQFLREKFSATSEEDDRPEMQGLPNTQGGSDVLTDAEVKKGIAKMQNGRACGLDKIPVELYKHCPECEQTLREILQKIWVTEEVPDAFARVTFIMLYKHKGSPNDPAKYRCIGLLNHAYKVLSQCMLARLETETEGFLSEWQAGFRKKRGCRDNVLVLRTIYDDMLEQGRTLYATFIDYSAAFDSVSHKFLDEALREAGASNKSRAMFRAMYKAASATVKVSDVDGGIIISDPFAIDRGVIQGDIVSPLYFILALDLILKRHDNVVPLATERGVMFGGRRVHTLGYADDAALLDGNIQTATARVTKIAAGSKSDADMTISISKTEVMQVSEQDRITPTTATEAKAVCKFACPNAEHGCDRVFFNTHGMR